LGYFQTSLRDEPIASPDFQANAHWIFLSAELLKVGAAAHSVSQPMMFHYTPFYLGTSISQWNRHALKIKREKAIGNFTRDNGDNREKEN